MYDEITRQSLEHINPKDVILTTSYSDLLVSFLKSASFDEASNQRTTFFEVLVCETAPSFTGHVTAKRLQQEGIHANIITDSSVYALMSKVHKVIISCQAVMQNGGLLCHSGAYQLALAAKVSPTLSSPDIN